MGFKENMVRNLRRSFNDKRELNQQALFFYRRLKEVERALRSGKGRE